MLRNPSRWMAVLSVLAGAVVAQAAIVPVTVVDDNGNVVPESNPTVTSTAGGFVWSYDMLVTSSAQVRTNNYFVIVDFAGYVAGSATAPAGWSVSVEPTTGPITLPYSGTFTLAHDDPALVNLRWTYTGATPANNWRETDLGYFTATSTFSNRRLGDMVAVDTAVGPKLELNTTTVEAPTSGMGTPVPLPAAAWTGLGLLGLLGGRRLLVRR